MPSVNSSKPASKDAKGQSLKQRSANLKAAAERAIRVRHGAADGAGAPDLANAGADPIFALLSAAREAERRANEPFPDVASGAPEDETGDEERARLATLSDDAHKAAFATLPATSAGLVALLDFAIEQQEVLERWDNGPDVLGAIRKAVAVLMGPDNLPTTTPSEGADPVFAAIEEHSVAYAEYDRISGIQNVMTPGHPDSDFVAAGAAIVESIRRERAALAALLATAPTTMAGALAFAEYAYSVLHRNDEEEGGRQALRLVATGLRSLSLGSELGAARPSAAYKASDDALLILGRRLDAAQATWRAAAEADATKESERRNPVEEAAFLAIEVWAEAIGKLPASTVAGLAVRARAALFGAWPGSNYPDLLKDEAEADYLDVFRLVEACCAAAGVDWRGEPIGEGF